MAGVQETLMYKAVTTLVGTYCMLALVKQPARVVLLEVAKRCAESCTS